MKLIIYILLFLFTTVNVFGQTTHRTDSVNRIQQLTYNKGGYAANIMRMPLSFAYYTDMDSTGLFWFQDGVPYYHNGTDRVAMVSGEGDSLTFLTVYRFDTATTNIYGAINAISGADSSVFFTVYRSDTMRSNLYAALMAKIAYTDTSGTIPTTYQLDTAKTAIRAQITPHIDTTSLSNRINLKQNFSDTSTFDATRYWVGTQIPSLTGYVPYTGATANVDLGSYHLITNNVEADTIQAQNSAGLSIQTSGNSPVMVLGAGGGQTITLNGYTTTTIGDTVLSTNSSGALQRYDLKSKLANYYLTSNPNGYTSNTGTVTSVAAGYGTNFTAITSTGSVVADSFVIASRLRLEKLKDSITAIGYLTPTSTSTLTNKRFTARVQTTTNFTTSVTIDADSYDMVTITAQAGALLFNAPSGTATEGQILVIRIKDNGTARALTYNGIFRGGTLTPPATTVINRILIEEWIYNLTDTKWDLVGFTFNY